MMNRSLLAAIGLALASAGVHAEVLTHWKMDGDLLDSSGNLGDLTLNGGGTFNGSGEFDGSLTFTQAQYAEDTPAALTALRLPGAGNSITVSFWAQQQFESNGGVQSSVFYAANNVGGRVFQSHVEWTNGRIYWDAGADPGSGGGYRRVDQTGGTTADQLHHYALTYDGTANQMRIFKDGAIIRQNSPGNDTIDWAGITNFEIGRGNSGWRGTIDDFAVFDAALSPAEVVLVRDNGVAAYERWNRDGGTGNWTDTANWVNGSVAQGAGSTANLNNNLTLDTTANLAAPNTVGTLNLSDPDGSNVRSITGSTLTLDNRGNGAAINNLAGKTTISAPLSFSEATAIDVAGGSTLVVAGPTSGSPASITVDSGGVFELNVTGGSRNYSNMIFDGGGTLRKTGAGTAIWTTPEATFAMDSGALIDVQGGTLVGGSYGDEVWTTNLSDLNVAAGAVFDGVEANVRVDALTGAGTVRTGYPGAGYQRLTIGVDNGSGTFSGIIANSVSPGVLRKDGTGTQTLTGANTYSGATQVVGGTLEAVSNSSVHSLSTGVVAVGGGTTVRLLRANDSWTVPNTFTGTGTLELAFSTTSTARDTKFAGTGSGLESLNGTLELTRTGASTGDKFNTDVSDSGINAPNLDVIVNDGTQLFVVDTAVFKSVTAQGDGNTEQRGGIRLTETLNAPVLLSGDLSIGTENGTLNGDVSTSVPGSHALTFGTPNSGADATINGDVSDGAGTLSLVKNRGGTVTLTGSNSYSGTTTITDGTLRLTNTANSIGGDITVTGGELVAVGPSLGTADVTLNGGKLTLATAEGVHFIEVANNGIASRRLHVGELEAFDPTVDTTTLTNNAGGTGSLNPGTDLAVGPTASLHTYGGPFQHGSAGNLVNAAESTGAGTWSLNPGVGNYVVVNLGADRDVGTVRVHQRNDSCCPDRLEDFTVNLYANNGGSPGDLVASGVFPGRAPTNSFAEFSFMPNLSNTVVVAADSSIDIGSGVPTATLGGLTFASGGQTLTVNAIDGGQGLTFTGATSIPNGDSTISVGTGAEVSLAGNLSGGSGANLVKSGDGAMTVSGNNVGYTGSFTHEGGNLAFSSMTAFGSASGLYTAGGETTDLTPITTGNGTFAPISAVVLSGNGTVDASGGTFQWNDNVTLSPGNSPGTMPIVGDVDWNGASGGGTYNWELLDWSGSTPGLGGDWDLITIDGQLDLTGGSGVIALLESVPGPLTGMPDPFLKTTKEFSILTATSIIGFNSFSVSFTDGIGLKSYQLLYDAGTESLILRWRPVPEPGTWAMLGMLMLAMVAWRRRQQS